MRPIIYNVFPILLGAFILWMWGKSILFIFPILLIVGFIMFRSDGGNT